MSIIVYILHADAQPSEEDQTPHHYIGSVRVDQFARRMRAHINGHGSKPTARLWARGYCWSLVKLWPTKTRAFEYALQKTIPARALCPVCNRMYHPAEQLSPKFKALSFERDQEQQKSGAP